MITKEDFEKYKEISEKLYDIGCNLEDILGEDTFRIRHEGGAEFSISYRGCCGSGDDRIMSIEATPEELSQNTAYILSMRFRTKLEAEREAAKLKREQDQTAIERAQYERLKAKFGV